MSENGYSNSLAMRLTHSQSANLPAIVYIVTYTYPNIILNIDISSKVNKVIQYIDMVTFSCQAQGSCLIEKKKL